MKLQELEYTGRVEKILVSTPDSSLETRAVDQLAVGHEGLPGDRHTGYLKSAGGRDKPFYTRGTTIRNHRQWSAVSVEELKEVSSIMKIDEIKPEWIGANLLVSGIPSFTKLPPLSRLKIGRSLVLIVYEENLPCDLPQPFIEQGIGRNIKPSFSSAGKDRRGLVGWIEREGSIKTGDEIKVFIPAP
jgi:hypothetical protein